MKKVHLITLLALLTIVASCTKSGEEVNEVEESQNKEIASMEEVTPKEEEIVEVEIDTVVSKVPDSLQPKSIEPITSLPIVSIFAKPLPGLSQNIDMQTIPTEDQVGISSYPNAVIIQVDDKNEYKGKFYVSMELTTSDDVQKVLAYYTKEEAHWTHIEKNGIHTFKMDPDKYFRETNTLQVLPLNKIMYEEVDSLLGYEAKTLIRIYFEIEPEVKNTSKTEELAYATPVNG